MWHTCDIRAHPDRYHPQLPLKTRKCPHPLSFSLSLYGHKSLSFFSLALQFDPIVLMLDPFVQWEERHCCWFVGFRGLCFDRFVGDMKGEVYAWMNEKRQTQKELWKLQKKRSAWLRFADGDRRLDRDMKGEVCLSLCNLIWSSFFSHSHYTDTNPVRFSDKFDSFTKKC